MKYNFLIYIKRDSADLQVEETLSWRCLIQGNVKRNGYNNNVECNFCVDCRHIFIIRVFCTLFGLATTRLTSLLYVQMLCRV